MEKTLHSGRYKQLVNWLKHERETQGLTIRDLALKLRVPHSLVGKIEQAERRLDVIEYVEYCKALDLSPAEGLDVVESFKD